MEQLQNTLNIVHKHFLVLYDVFVASVGLNNNTIVYAQHWIWIGIVSLIPDANKMTGSEPMPILSIGWMHPKFKSW